MFIFFITLLVVERLKSIYFISLYAEDIQKTKQRRIKETDKHMKNHITE